MLIEKLRSFIERYQEIDKLLMSEDILSNIKQITELSKEKNKIEPVVFKAREYIQTCESIEENKSYLNDDEMADIAKEEIKTLEANKPILEEEIQVLLIPKDENDGRNVFLEIRAGAGGDEASIFAGDIYDMYIRFIELNSWKVELISSSEGTNGGYKEIIILVKGNEAHTKLKYESGVHRVQRVPDTESQGRVHTSAISVAIIPEVDDIDIDIKQSDLKIDVMRSSGNGGQSVNTTDSAVRITHLPSGLVVTNQDGKSQHKNKDKAMKVLKARLFDLEMSQRQSDEKDARKSQVGSGDRSEKIRTYNYPQNRITDHRINLTLYKLDNIMESGNMNEIVSALITEEQSLKMKAL